MGGPAPIRANRKLARPAGTGAPTCGRRTRMGGALHSVTVPPHYGHGRAAYGCSFAAQSSCPLTLSISVGTLLTGGGCTLLTFDISFLFQEICSFSLSLSLFLSSQPLVTLMRTHVRFFVIFLPILVCRDGDPLTGTVAENVRYGPALRGKKLTDAEVAELLSLADLDPSLASRGASELSVGQAQRVALARTLANDPEVVLLDEPTSALDPISTQNIEEAIVRLKKARGLTIVMVSHSVKQIQRLADVVCLVVDGEIVEVMEPSHLSRANHPTARRFIELSL